MKILTFISTILFIGTAVTAPGTALYIESPQKWVTESQKVVTEACDLISPHWAGAILDGGHYKSITATFNAPNLTSEGSGAAKLALDSETPALFRAGIEWINFESTTYYNSMFEWFPGQQCQLTLKISAGDTIKVTITTLSSTVGTVTIENLTTRQSSSTTLVDQPAVSRRYAYWYVDDHQGRLANFGTFNFTDCSATGDSGVVGISGAELVTMVQGRRTLVTCSTPSSSSVTCDYV